MPEEEDLSRKLRFTPTYVLLFCVLIILFEPSIQCERVYSIIETQIEPMCSLNKIGLNVLIGLIFEFDEMNVIPYSTDDDNSSENRINRKTYHETCCLYSDLESLTPS